MPIHDIRLDTLDISFVLENTKDFVLETGCWNIYGIMTSTKRVLQSYQEVTNRICNHTKPTLSPMFFALPDFRHQPNDVGDGQFTNSPSELPEFHPSGSTSESRFCTFEIAARILGHDHRFHIGDNLEPETSP